MQGAKSSPLVKNREVRSNEMLGDVRNRGLLSTAKEHLLRGELIKGIMGMAHVMHLW